ISSTMSCDRSRMSSKSPPERVRTPESSGRRPVIASTWCARAGSSSANAEPTVPCPRSPTLNDVTREEVVVGLAPDDDLRVAVAAEDHGRPRHAVVVVGQRVAVGAGGGDGDHVARPRLGEVGVAHDDVAGFAVLADEAAVGPAAEAIGDLRLVASAV